MAPQYKWTVLPLLVWFNIEVDDAPYPSESVKDFISHLMKFGENMVESQGWSKNNQREGGKDGLSCPSEEEVWRASGSVWVGLTRFSLLLVPVGEST